MFRQRLVANVANPVVREYWLDEFDARSNAQGQITAPLLNKVRAFLRHPIVRDIVRQPKSPDFSQILNIGKILLVRLDADLPEATSLLGSTIVLKLLHAAMGRQALAPQQRHPFFIYADEFQRFATEDFGTLIQEARKFGVGTILAHQMRRQLDRQLQSFVLGSGTLVCFQLTSEDAREMEREFPEPKETVCGMVAAEDPVAWYYDNFELVDSLTRQAVWGLFSNLMEWLVEEPTSGYSPRRSVYFDERKRRLGERLYLVMRGLLPPQELLPPEWIYQHHVRASIKQNATALGTFMQKEYQCFLNGAPIYTGPAGALAPLSELPLLTARARLDRGHGWETVQVKVEHVLSQERRSQVRDRLTTLPAVSQSRRRYTTKRSELDPPPQAPAPPPPAPASDVIYYDEEPAPPPRFQRYD